MLNNLIQHFTYSLLLAASLTYLLPFYWKKSLLIKGAFFVVALGVVNFLSVWHGNSLVDIVYGAISDLSITSVCLIMIFIITSLLPVKLNLLFSKAEKIIIFFCGALLYSSVLGFIDYDVYASGYHYLPLVLFCCSLSLILILANCWLGYFWLCALLAYYFHLLPSNNLWDYLFDPLAWLMLIGEQIYLLWPKRQARNYYEHL